MANNNITNYIDSTVMQTHVSPAVLQQPDQYGIAQAANRASADLYNQQLSQQTMHRRTMRAAANFNRPNAYTQYHAHKQSKSAMPWKEVKK